MPPWRDQQQRLSFPSPTGGFWRPQGEERALWAERRSFFASLRLPAATVSSYSAWNGGLTPLTRREAYDLRPTDLRPDGETRARDFLAGFVMKWSTRHNGIQISYYNHNRCAPNGWEPVAADGSSVCRELGPPDLAWQDDGDTFDEGGQPLSMPMATLGSSGLPDADVPGGYLLDIAGTPALANPDFDGCAYPHTWVPDRLRLPDVSGGPSSALDGHTFRFGRTDFDFRLVVHTNTRRDFCPGDGG